jgi:restriction system protein
MADRTVWGIHAKGAQLEPILLERNSLAIGWPALGDLGAIATNRETLKTALAAAYPNDKPGAIPVNAGQLFRFINEMATGDVVVYRSKSQGRIYLGEVDGPYKWDATGDPEHPNRRPVKWLKNVPVTAISQGALYELGSILTFFQIKNYAEEWLSLLSGVAPEVAQETDESLVILAESTEQNTRDFILKQLSKDLKGHPFAYFVANVLQAMGYRTRVSPEGADGGIDIVAHRDELGLEPPIVRVQVKSGSGTVGGPEVSQLLGNLEAGDFGLFVTLGTFAPQAKQKATSRLRLINGEDLVDLILSNYEQLDAAYKRVIPLKRMYVPQRLGTD